MKPETSRNMPETPRILCLSGSPRPTGNSQTLVDCFAEGAREEGAEVEIVRAFDLDIQPCKGCLRCNVLKRCSIKGDDWPGVAESIRNAHGILFASPVYFHHVTGSLKLLLDRMRSLLHVQMVPGGDGLEHAARYDADKEYALLLVQGAAGTEGVTEVLDLVRFVASFGGRADDVEWLVGNRLGLSGQVRMTEEELASAYEKLGLPTDRAAEDARYNLELQEKARAMGRGMAARIREK
jgi:multimeric flavodoxin WrbA